MTNMLPIDAFCLTCKEVLAISRERPEVTPKRTYRTAAAGATQSGEGALWGWCEACQVLVENVAAFAAFHERDRRDLMAATDASRRAREIFREMHDSRKAMTELALAFHVLKRSTPGVDPWDPMALDEWTVDGDASEATRDAASFVLRVWNAREPWRRPLDVMNALARWDRLNRAVFVEWARDPWWP